MLDKTKSITAVLVTFFDIGNRLLNILHAKLRNNCSSLNYDLYRVNLIVSPTCRCGSYRENTHHYLLHCNLKMKFGTHFTIFTKWK